MKRILMLAGLPVLFLTGCWTVRKPVDPEIPVVQLPKGREIRVQLAGFDAQVTKYVPAYGYSTVTTFGGGPHPYCSRSGYYDSGLRTSMVSTTEFVPQLEATPAYWNRATDILEHAGCILQTKDPQYKVEVRFEGPFDEPGDTWAAVGWALCTLLTADYGAQDWTAKLKVYDVKTGRLLHEKDHRQRYETIVWGPIPLFSLGSERTSGSVMQDWCLSMLTETTAADALTFLSSVK